MDSVTQAVLGAAIGGLCAPAGKRRRGLWYGAALGTLPDLDVLVRYANPVDNLVEHRSWSHSLIVLAVLAPILYSLCARVDQHLKVESHRWRGLFALVLLTHPLLDWFTAYGTQLLWPFDRTPFALASVFILDPFFTVPLLVTVLMCAVWPAARWYSGTLSFALLWSAAYLVWSLVAQSLIRERVERALAADPEAFEERLVFVSPAPFSTLLWRVVVREPLRFREAYMGLFVDAEPLWRSFESLDLTERALAQSSDFAKLKAFNGGLYWLWAEDDRLYCSDLRMGSMPSFVFSFELAQRQQDGWAPIAARQRPMQRPPLSALPWLLQRTYTPAADLPPADQLMRQ